MKIYYAHPQSWYNTDREKADLQCIADSTPMGTEIVNPNSDHFRDMVDGIKGANGGTLATGDFSIMKLFVEAVAACDCVAYRTFDDGSIGAGVGHELLTAAVHGKQIFRLMNRYRPQPAVVMQEERHGLGASFGPRLITIVQTRDYIKRGVL